MIKVKQYKNLAHYAFREENFVEGGLLTSEKKKFRIHGCNYSFEFKFRQWTTAPFNVPPEGSA